MPGQQQDYILRQIELLGRFAASLRRRGKPLDEQDKRELNENLLLAMHLQEQNFGMPAAQFAGLTAEEQITALRKSESKPTGQERCLMYAALLKETADLYAYRDSEELALGARQLGLYVALSVALDQPADPRAAHALVDELRNALGEAELHAPTRELLERFEQASST
jgi:hypothetical protein